MTIIGGAGVDSCPEGQGVNSEVRGIFDELSADEIEIVINYTRQIVCFRGQCADYSSIISSSSEDGNNVSMSIAVIELHPPMKIKALHHLDDGGPPPCERNARVVLYRPVHRC